ncbi:hypothetical protein [Paraburkholderia unamae]|uniref:Uncharacterized protein n=1 Tax=Paraburkholderia unamae TaxID=219649 RepID=A0ACC6RIZ6_9BURK
MAGFQDITTIIVEQFKVSNKLVPCIMGAPGGGKSALAIQIGEKGEEYFGVPFDNVIIFNASLRDPTDLLGMPNVHGECARWLPPEELYTCRTGRNLIIIEEIGDMSPEMSNAMCGLLELRQVNNLKLSDETYIIATGNRTEDKSGAQRMTTKLANRVQRFDFDTRLDDWCDWALGAGVDVQMIQFLRFKPNLLHDFDANRLLNPSPRAWAKANLVPATLDSVLYMDAIAGNVGQGAAAEYTAFRRIADNLPSIDSILMNPATVDVPEDVAVRFALIGAIAQRTTKDNIDRLIEFTNRMPVDFNVMYMNDVTKMQPDVKKTKAFVSWAVKNANALV